MKQILFVAASLRGPGKHSLHLLGLGSGTDYGRWSWCHAGRCLLVLPPPSRTLGIPELWGEATGQRRTGKGLSLDTFSLRSCET